MDDARISDYYGKKVKVWLLGQSQLNVTPGITTEGTLIGMDQGVYIIRTSKNDGRETVLIPVSQCRISVIE